MKVFNFHLMPYRHIDLDAIGRNGSAWVTLSNAHYDPQLGAELYHDYLDQMELADRLGFDGVCLNEHHQTAYGMMPIPGVLAGALGQAREARRARTRPAVAQQPADGGGRIRHAGQPDPRPLHRRIRARHRRRIPRHGDQPGAVAGALRRSARSDRAGLDRTRAVRLRRQALSLQLRQHLAAALSVAASADLDSIAGFGLDHPLGRPDALHLLPNAEPDRGGGTLLPALSR